MRGNWKYKGNTTKPGKHIWDEFVNEETGETTLEIHRPQKTSEWDNCEHYWEIIDNMTNIQCQKCGLGKRLVWGMQFLKDGKIVDKL